MQSHDRLVTIVIPAYNAASYIEETIQSIYKQTYPFWEIVIVNDGSTDNTDEIIRSFRDDRITHIIQKNAGVAAARNKGSLYAKGEFIVFFDADDIMTQEFLSERVNALKEDSAIGYAGGLIQSFPDVEIRKAATDPVNEILFFNASFATVPSNYIFRRKLLVENNITFNQELSSSADRFFILEVSKFAKGKNIQTEKGNLLYRVTAQSMSNLVTPKLIKDNERFFYELKKKRLLPDGKVQKFKSFYFLSLAIGFGMVRYWKHVVKYLAMSFINHPVFFTRACGKRIISFPYLKLTRTNG